jgi:kynurenine formamidase
MLDGKRVVDLTQPLDANTLMWLGAPALHAEATCTVEADGFFDRLITLVEHSGTHIDAPAHVVAGGATVDQIAPDRLVAPLAVIDISAETVANPDTTLTLDHVRAWERRHGTVPHRSAVFLRTGWEAFSTDPVRYAGAGGALRFPGFGPEAARYLVEERGVVGLGVDTLSIDPGVSTDFVVHRQVSLPRGVWHIENLVNLSQVPPVGAWVMVGALKLVGGSGSPVRVLALVPSH